MYERKENEMKVEIEKWKVNKRNDNEEETMWKMK